MFYLTIALKLICNRNSDGKLNLYVNQVNPDNKWNDAGNAWFSATNNIYSKARIDFWLLFYNFASIPFFQPPSILPISVKRSFISAYCLCVIRCASHAVCSKKVTMSFSKIDFVKNSLFFCGGA